MKTIQVVFVLVTFYYAWSLPQNQQDAAPDGTVPAEPLSVVPPPQGSASPVPSAASVPVATVPAAASAPVQPAAPLPASRPVAPYPDITGSTTETKNPDGSTITVTHFRGPLPPNAFPYAAGFPAWGHPVPPPPYPFYPWGYPQFPPRYQNQAPIPVTRTA